MEEQKTYHIYEILTAAANWLDDPEDEEKTKAIDDIKMNLVIKDYVPLRQKELVLRKALLDIRSNEDILPYTASILYEIALMFDCLLAYVVNIEYDIDSVYKDADFYDVLKMSGISDYILSFCEKDYEDLRKMADRMISFDNLMELSKAVEITSPEQIDKLTDEFKRFRTELDPEMLKQLSNIMAGNDPLVTTIKTAVENEAFKAAQMVGEDFEDKDDSKNLN